MRRKYMNSSNRKIYDKINSQIERVLTSMESVELDGPEYMKYELVLDKLYDKLEVIENL